MVANCFIHVQLFVLQAIWYYEMVRFRIIDLKSHPIAQFLKKNQNVINKCLIWKNSTSALSFIAARKWFSFSESW